MELKNALKRVAATVAGGAGDVAVFQAWEDASDPVAVAIDKAWEQLRPEDWDGTAIMPPRPLPLPAGGHVRVSPLAVPGGPQWKAKMRPWTAPMPGPRKAPGASAAALAAGRDPRSLPPPPLPALELPAARTPVPLYFGRSLGPRSLEGDARMLRLAAVGQRMRVPSDATVATLGVIRHHAA